MKEIKVIADKENIEDIVIKEHATGSIENEKQIILSMMKVLNTVKKDGETVSAFEDRLIKDAKKVINL